MHVKFRHAALLLGSACLLIGLHEPAATQKVQTPQVMTLEQALSSAYYANPTMNAQRAATRAVDEAVPQALAGYRPKVQGNAEYGIDHTRIQTPLSKQERNIGPRGYGITAQQNLFNGFQTGNLTRSAESQVQAARETLRNTEQNVLLDAVAAYVNVLRDSAIVQLRRGSLEALNEQLRATRDRFNVGELTRTDVAQAQARVAQSESELAGAIADLNASRAAFRRDIGVEPPSNLTPARAYEKIGVSTLDAAIAEAFGKHPAIMAARHGVDTASLQVKVAEGALLPTINLEASAQRFSDPSFGVDNTFDAQAAIRLSVPIYNGGADHSKIRQNKEIVGQRQLESDVTRDAVRAAVIASWGQVTAARAQIEAAQAQVAAAEIALNGVREEYRVGQRTTLDVLNAQTELVTARVALVQAQRNRVVASYSLLSSVGRLSLAELGIVAQAQTYQPEVHYEQVRDLWFGLRTPDGK
jgi:outer membrane protein